MAITGRTKLLAVIGWPVEHSLSPVMHNAAIEALGLDFVYVPFKVQPGSIGEFVNSVRDFGIAGFNATIPHKEIVVPLLDKVGESVKHTGSANTVINKNGYLIGESTDGIGFMRAAEDELGDISGVRTLVLGAGGSARAVCAALRQAGSDVVICNRTVARALALKELLEDIPGKGTVEIVQTDDSSFAQTAKECGLIVNTTSVGMTPYINNSPLDPDVIMPYHRIFDLVYSPFETLLARQARAKGAVCATGLKMLVYQGAESFRLWTGLEPPVHVMLSALQEHLALRYV